MRLAAVVVLSACVVIAAAGGGYFDSIFDMFKHKKAAASPAKESWPELAGQPIEAAKAQILKDKPDANVVVLPPTVPRVRNFVSNRVVLADDGHGKVMGTPSLG